MKRSIFKRVTSVFFTAGLLTAVLACAISFVYNTAQTAQTSAKSAEAGARTAAQILKSVNIDDLKKSSTSELYKQTREHMRAVCQSLELEYLYVYETRPSEGTVCYIMTVAADDEKDANVAYERGLGTVVERQLTEQEFSALEGNPDLNAYVEDNAFGKVYSWFYPLDIENGVLIGSDYRADTLFLRVVRGTLIIVVPMLLVLFLIFLAAMYVLHKQISVPIRLISEKMRGFITDGGMADLNSLNINSGDEIQEISDSFEKMSKDISRYLGDIERLTAERLQRDIELSVAGKIQNGIVPKWTAIDNIQYEICACAKPEKEVGGDFYDCFTREDGTLCFAIGDVSGKGIAAAMFMVMSQTMIKSCMISGMSPAQALNYVNDSLCRSNPEGMFLTAFAAVLHTEDGQLQYANAGHTKPVIFGNRSEFIKTDTGIALGLFEDADIKDVSIRLEKNSGIMIYTDGVTEAVNANNKFFGKERLKNAVKTANSAKEATGVLNEAVKKFAEGANQFDDYTVLAVYYKGGSRYVMSLKNHESEIDRLSAEVMKHLSGSKGRKAVLACEEAFSNIMNYSCAEEIQAVFENHGKGLRVVFSDNGKVFNPLEYVSDKTFEELDDGGMGISMIKQVADNVSYEYKNGRNILTLDFYGESE